MVFRLNLGNKVTATTGISGLKNSFHSYSSCRASDLKIHLPCSKTYLPCIFVW